jgi:hypothetical protein
VSPRTHLPRDLDRALRRWEKDLWFATTDARQQEMQLWANVVLDALHTIYRSRSLARVALALEWLLGAAATCSLADCAEVVGIHVADVQRTVLADIAADRTARAKELLYAC